MTESSLDPTFRRSAAEAAAAAAEKLACVVTFDRAGPLDDTWLHFGPVVEWTHLPSRGSSPPRQAGHDRGDTGSYRRYLSSAAKVRHLVP
jgi:selenium-binding protein 1